MGYFLIGMQAIAHPLGEFNPAATGEVSMSQWEGQDCHELCLPLMLMKRSGGNFTLDNLTFNGLLD